MALGLWDEHWMARHKFLSTKGFNGRLGTIFADEQPKQMQPDARTMLSSDTIQELAGQRAAVCFDIVSRPCAHEI
jgi:hypothetical protein